MVFFAEFGRRDLFKQSQGFLTRFDFGVAARRCRCFTNDGVMYYHCGEYTGRGSIDSREFTRFEAVVGASILVGEFVVQVGLYMD